MLISHEQLGDGAPVPGGRPNAEPGGGRASGAAQRRRLDLSTAQFGSAGRSDMAEQTWPRHGRASLVPTPSTATLRRGLIFLPGSFTPGGGVSVQGNAGGSDQSSALAEVDRAAGEPGGEEVDLAAGELGAAEVDRAAGELGAAKLTVPPENSAPLKSTWPPENWAPMK